MKTMLLLSLTLVTPIIFGQNWHQITDFPGTERDDGTSFIIDDVAYCGTGLLPWFAPSSDFYAFNSTFGEWTAIASMPASEDRQYACGFSYGAKGYIFGGVNGANFLNDLWEYSPITDSWIEKSSIPSLGISGASCFVIGDTAYIIGGKDVNGTTLSSVWAYSFSSDSWIQKNDFPFAATWRSSGCSSDAKGYLIFGKEATNTSNNKLYAYEPILDSWSELTTFPLPYGGRSYSFLTMMDNNLVTGFGIDDDGNYYSDLWEFDLITSNWHEWMSNNLSPRKGGLCFNFPVINLLYYTTGISSTNERLNEMWYHGNFVSLEKNNWVDFEVYPNPASESITIQSSEEIQSVELLNLLGKTTAVFKGSSSFSISEFPNGYYFLKIHCADQFYITRLEILR